MMNGDKKYIKYRMHCLYEPASIRDNRSVDHTQMYEPVSIKGINCSVDRTQMYEPVLIRDNCSVDRTQMYEPASIRDNCSVDRTQMYEHVLTVLWIVLRCMNMC